jgi:hypothetical protein
MEHGHGYHERVRASEHPSLPTPTAIDEAPAMRENLALVRPSDIA